MGALQADGVIIFDTYVGAAVTLFQLGLLDADALVRTAREICSELCAIRRDRYHTPAVYQARRLEFMRDLEALRKATGCDVQLPDVTAADQLQMWNPGASSASTRLAAVRQPQAAAGNSWESEVGL